ncbi:MAG TPA: methyl-accepting chemotaxis protein [Candidatus Elarobacter sp.]
MKRLPEGTGADAEPAGVAWLQQLAQTRDLTLSRTGIDLDASDAAILERLLASLRREMLDFREIVEAAVETASLNAEQLAEIVANTVEQSAVVEQAAAAISEIDRGAAHVAETTEALHSLTSTMSESAERYDAGTTTVLEQLKALGATVEEAAAFAGSMDRGARGIAAFLEQLRSIARQATLLGINAAIEAAHLGDTGKGFVIVAQEVRTLASSTADSAKNVGLIEKEFRAASLQVDGAIADASVMVRGLTGDLDAVRARTTATRQQVRELDSAIEDVATIAAEQSANLSSLNHSVEQIARHAEEISTAAERAAQLAINEALGRLAATIGAYRLGAARDGAAYAAVDLAALSPGLREAAEALRARIDADQRELLGLVTEIAVSIARNGFEWRAIADGLTSLRAQFEATVKAIDETAAGAEAAATASRRMRSSLDAMRAGFATSVDDLRQCLERVARVRESVQNAESSVSTTAEAGERATAILELIDTISSETTLLSLNAAIEAAHAGTAGAGFGVIADEIRSLAATTSHATQEIGGVVAGVAEASRAMSERTADAVQRTVTVRDETSRMQATVGDLSREVGGTLEQAAAVAGVVEQQLTALSQVRTATEAALRRIESDRAAATDSRRLDLAMLGMRAHGLAARRPLGTVAEQIRAVGLDVAGEMDRVFDAAIAGGSITLEDCFDTNYVEITGPAIRKLGRLFDVSKVPPAGFKPPKFETRYDRAVEDGINALIDAGVPKHPAIKAMFAVDLNGFCFGHYRECRQDWTGIYAVDLENNRIKRFFDDALSLRCARVGLGAAADALPARTPYDVFRSHGCTVKREAERPFAIFTYARDTGIVYNDLSVALYARDRRVGTIRIIYDADAI